ncbi:toxin-antitoxin system YwqK family antitoxin [Polaribacter uvawellassae]|uniref:toxin-antitoxin system YwqK family antitoxin n=1 Tax=Polaribacter uvawellassae TaxID=3133495 RepID=UPI00321ABF79
MKKTIVILFLVFASCEKNEKPHLVLFEENKELEIINGVLYYNDAPFNGTIKSFDDVNQTKNSASYENGKKEGEERKLFLNDSLAEIRFYKKGLKVGIHKSWFENGQQKFEYPYSQNGVYHGTMKEWYPNGKLVREFNYTKGKESGSQKMWLSNGNIKANYTVVNGERFGLIGLKKCYSVKTK